MNINIFYNTKHIKLYQGNCLEVLNSIPENTFDMIFADPPYFLSNGTFTCQNGQMVSVKKGNWDIGKTAEENFKFHFEWLKECKRVLKQNGTLWVSGTYHSIYQCGYALQLLDYHVLNDIAWLKPNASPNLSCRFFTASHETLTQVMNFFKKRRNTLNIKNLNI